MIVKGNDSIDTVKQRWGLLVDLVKLETDPKDTVNVSLEEEILNINTPEKVLVLAENNIPAETEDFYKKPSQAIFYFAAIFNDKKQKDYLGSSSRVLDKDDIFLGYSQDFLDRVKHQTALRLQRLNALDREVFFESELFGIKKIKVTQEVIDSLKKVDSDELNTVYD